MDPLSWLRKRLEEAGPDVLREMVKSFAEALMGAEADALCGAAFRERTGERVNRRNGYRERLFDTRTGRIALAVPKLRSGSYFPDWLMERRRRAERALVSVVCECYVRGATTRRVDGLVKTLGIEHLCKSQVSQMAKSLDEEVATFRSRPLDEGPYLWLDALAVKVREEGRICKVCWVVASAVNAEGRPRAEARHLEAQVPAGRPLEVERYGGGRGAGGTAARAGPLVPLRPGNRSGVRHLSGVDRELVAASLLDRPEMRLDHPPLRFQGGAPAGRGGHTPAEVIQPQGFPAAAAPDADLGRPFPVLITTIATTKQSSHQPHHGRSMDGV